MALYTHAAVAIAAAAAAGFAGWQVRDWQADATIAGIREKAWTDTLAVERAYENRVTDADKALTAARAKERVRAAADRDALERVRSDLDARDARQQDAACVHVEQPFAECRALLREGAGLAAEGRAGYSTVADEHDALRTVATPEVK